MILFSVSANLRKHSKFFSRMIIRTRLLAISLLCLCTLLMACEQTIYQPFPIGEGYRFHKATPRTPIRPGVADEIDHAFEARWRNVANQVALQILNDTRGVVDNFYLTMPEHPTKTDIFLDFYLREAFTNMDFTVLTRPTEGVIVRTYTDAPMAFEYRGVPEHQTAEKVLAEPQSGLPGFDNEQEVVIGYEVNDNGVIIAETNSTYLLPVTNPGEYLPWQFDDRYDY